MKYDPATRVDPGWWTSLGAEERVSLVEAAHVVPEAWHHVIHESRPHALLHVIAENLVARGDDIPVHAALQRLVRQGLSRHDAIHALASVCSEHARAIGSGRAEPDAPPPAGQIKAAAAMTAAKWRGQAIDGVGNRADRRSSARGRKPSAARAAARRKKKKRKKK